MAIGSFIIIAGLAITAESLVQTKDMQEKQELPIKKVYAKVNNITHRNK